MKIEIIREKLLGAVGFAERVAGKHVSLPILSSIVLDASGDQVFVKATNLDLGIEIPVAGKIFQKGSVALSGGILKSFLSNISDKNVVLEVLENTLNVVSERGIAKIKTVPSDDFPQIPQVKDGDTFSISSDDLSEIVKSVGYSASISTIKPELASIFIFLDGETLVSVATDSFRLAEKRIKLKKKSDLKELLIPEKNISEISKVFEGLKKDIEVRSNKNQVSFFADGIHVTSRAVDAVFPDYKQIIPKEFSSTCTILKEDLAQALKLTSAFSDNFNQVSVSLSVSKKTLSLKTKNNDVGESENSIKGSFSGVDVSINFNHRYIYECLQSINTESLSVNFAGANRPAVIKESSNNNSFTYLVMPMNR